MSLERGRAGEELAAAYLERQGLSIVARNVRCRVGEIDIVARDGASVVFVEVKERRGEAHGGGLERVDYFLPAFFLLGFGTGIVRPISLFNV